MDQAGDIKKILQAQWDFKLPANLPREKAEAPSKLYPYPYPYLRQSWEGR